MGTNIFFPHICFARQKEMTAGDFHLKEREIRNCPRQRSLYFPPNIRGNPKCPCHHHGHRSLRRQFHGNSKDNLGGHPSRVKHVKIVLGSKGRRDLLRKLGLQRSHVIRRLSPIYGRIGHSWVPFIRYHMDTVWSRMIPLPSHTYKLPWGSNYSRLIQ